MADDYNDGRKPSINYGRGGTSVRGFRSKPGSPMHDPTSNNPMSRDNSIPKSNWDSLFRNSLTGGMNPLSPEFRQQPQSAEIDPTFTAPGGDQTSEFNNQLRNRFNPNSLESMAAGGMNHAQRWSQAPALRPPDKSWSQDPFMPRGPKDKFYVDNQGGFFESPTKDGWKSTSLRESQAIGDKYKTKSPFGWGSAFNA